LTVNTDVKARATGHRLGFILYVLPTNAGRAQCNAACKRAKF